MGMHDLVDMKDMVFDQDEDGVHISGNMTTKWDLPRTDRISARFHFMHFDRGTWEPTVINYHSPNFCSAIFDENLYWFKYWFRYVVNREEIQDKCIATKDTLWIFKPFIMNLRIALRASNIRGRYKVVYRFEAFDENNNRRPTSVCFEIRGEAEKVKQ
ncbi:uncharacterized protein [Drosophila takahashii]|uniref:uncharacterized protein n=1 Tax=Drosophila takahashii TaxID=29030 RepID=UPI003898E65A